MPRKAFVADIQAAAEQNIPGISSVTKGPDDDVIVSFVPVSGGPIEIILMAQPDVSSYPSESMFMAYTNTNGVPKGAATVIEDISTFSFGVRLPELLTTVSQRLQRVLATGSREDPLGIDDDEDTEMVDADEGDDGEDDDDEDDDEEEEDYFSEDEFGMDSIRQGSTSHANATMRLSPESSSKINTRIRHDLRAAKLAGFSIGILSGMKAESVSSILCLSLRVAKLGLSEEAIQAWDLEPQQYIILLIRYSNGCKAFQDIINDPARTHDVSFRVGVGNKYKCTLLEALAAFSETAKDNNKSSREETNDTAEEPTKAIAGFSNIFISSSLNDFINSQFISLLKIRDSVGVGWDGAKRYFNDKQGHLDTDSAELSAEYFEESDTQKESTLPPNIATDHLTDIQVKTISFPLIAAQFTLRYLTRCTEFCLVCHDKIGEDFEALKPYVCAKPLCLYQYMSLGFGPSVEHEILTQPYVVDLLVSFCYSSAYARRLREYPTGMSLSVPPVTNSVTNGYVGYRGMQPPAAARTPALSIDPATVQTEVKFDLNRQEITFDGAMLSAPVRNGDWIVISTANRSTADHFRVEDISFFPLVKLASIAVNRQGQDYVVPPGNTSTVPASPATTPPPPSLVPATMTVYNHNFDEMNDAEKAETIVMLIETLPSIRDLRAYLVQQSRDCEPSLKNWKERVSPAALGILRWIIASNRSCIVQVDKCPGQTDIELAMSKARLDQRVSGISESWVQFRFAQGSPDKEQRFLNALRAQQSNFDAKYPTMFAFHGSPLPNWHSIIRSGLDFKETLHGRAYGHGVYHASDQNVSIGYAQPNGSIWHGSELKINSAMSLNEIVNCPSQFASSSPYIVVQHIDWIQCRYLFVQVQGGNSSATADYSGGAGNSKKVSNESDASNKVEQDPKHVAKSTVGKPIGVPLCAVSISRAFRVNESEIPAKKRRKHGSGGNLQQLTESFASDGENISDIEFFFSDDEGSSARARGKGKKQLVMLDSKKPTKPLTDFVAGSLDQSTLPMLQPPLYATSSASKTLTRNLKEVLEIQKKTPLHELGWYIDPDLISNVYQWIVELHSFDASLPLAKDMKTAGVTSIVLEIRFGKDYPFSPPFVRVIRPRFLPFQAGGGGHVTAGGAMCMELLTNTGWTSVSTIESVLLQVRVEMMSLDRPAHLESTSKQSQRDYGTAEAIDAYERSCKMHGWAIPPGFRDFANATGGGPSAY